MGFKRLDFRFFFHLYNTYMSAYKCTYIWILEWMNYYNLFHLMLKEFRGLKLWLWLYLFWSRFSMFSGIRLHWFLKLFGHRTQTTQPSSLFCSCLNISIFTEFPQQSINRLRLPTLFFSLQNILTSHTYGQSFVDLKKNLLLRS